MSEGKQPYTDTFFLPLHIVLRGAATNPFRPLKTSRDSADFTAYVPRGFGHNVGHVSPPSIERVLALREEVVSLVHGGNPRNRAGLVIKNLVGNMRRNAQPSHPGGTGPAQIMEPPASHSRELIK